ncbi:probable leucine--tRNA ligase, mitochondrial [Vespa mandarinia]|uniref:probable leucine--tRNA ligase, mitochondrial n=1 Tax=Vespa mandarinia TaxID=7446 RepID=UPI0016220EC5|nr:probable leucine--tRNA ligase, mitochondrial [Vespa mandarinia]
MKYGFINILKPIFNKRHEYFLKIVIKRRASTGICSLKDDDLNITTKNKIELYWKNKVNPNLHDKNDTTKDKFYVLSMFPYPSGKLHMGHVRVYTISDVIARFYRMTGKNVIHPIGWDAFGLPAENAAIEQQIDPSKWTVTNINIMRKQLNALNFSFDWNREISTCDPEYYRWTQELFLKLFEKDLIYRKEEYVNWDPIDETVLAEEQVDINNISWRSGAKVEKRLLNQWFIRTTAFAKSLLDGLNDPILEEWKDIIKIQKNWIGDCNGVSFDFKLVSDISELPKIMNLWTDKPEFVKFAKFVVISPSNALNQQQYSENVNATTKKLKATVINPFTEQELPIFISDELVFPPNRENYLGIPSASIEDYKFAESVEIPFQRHNIRSHEELQCELNEILIKAKKWKIGGHIVSSRLKDWLISRQRYWGTPIPIIHCKNCGIQPVPRNQLPVILPNINFNLSEKNHFTLLDAKEWLQTVCPKCGNHAIREADTMDTFVDSCWYFLRYIDPKNQEEIFSVEKVKKALPVDLYIGGKEHATLHLYYARFINHFLYEEGLVPTREPFKQLLVQGMVMGKTYQISNTGQYIKESDVIKDETDNQYYEKNTGRLIKVTWEKMSKSKYNGVDPLELLENYGVDTTRILILADVAPTSHRNWSTDTIRGVQNWENRIWLTLKEFIKMREHVSLEELQTPVTDPKYVKDNEFMFDSRNYFLKMVTFNIIKSQQISVAISRMQGLTNSLRKVCNECKLKSREYERALATQIIMLAPLVPHFASELWTAFCSIPHHLINKEEVLLDKDVLEQKWPEIDMDYKMKMNVYVDKQLFMEIKVPRHTLDKLTVQEASELIMTKPFYQKLIRKRTITDVKLLSQIACDANLYITTNKILEKISS